VTISSLFGTPSADEAARRRLWHVTLTVAGQPCEPDDVRAALERLNHERPFFLTSRYDATRVELRYWEEAESCEDACALALRLWGEHRATADLPAWGVVGLEVVERGLRTDRGDASVVDARIAPFL
jgi:hypothetical protein